MEKYKSNYRNQIYDLNYDLLVKNSECEIKKIVSWLGWEWNNSYLTPEKNNRSVLTASSVEVRSQINSKSVGGWRNYKSLLKPAINILIKNKKYKATYK